ncbi:hypothetical protein K1719_021307 [Acacia pycnantha]|nr:hypothetical protein K1719_021307 [Acacia pycnantha]
MAANSFFLCNPIVLNAFPLEDNLQPPMNSNSLSFPPEMDFFSNNDLKLPSASSSDDSSTPPHPLDFKLNTGLNLLTTSGDHSEVEDTFGIYSNFKEKRAKTSELETENAGLRAELEDDGRES